MALRENFPGALFFIPCVLIIKIVFNLPLSVYLLASFVIFVLLPEKYSILGILVLLPAPIDFSLIPDMLNTHFYEFIYTGFNASALGGRSLAIALCTGNTQLMSVFEKSLFYQSGNAHLLALSGMHFGILCGVFSLVVGLFIKGKGTLLATSFFAIVLCYMLGPIPSLIRALFFVLARLLSKFFELQWKNIHMLLLAFVFQVYLFPSHLYEKGFVLSYMAVCGLFVCTAYFQSGILRHLPHILKGSWSASLGCFLFTAPVLFVSSDLLPVGGLLLAPLILPLFTLFYIVSLLLLLLGSIVPFLSNVHFFIYRIFMRLLNAAVNMPSITNYVFWGILSGACVFLLLCSIYRRISWERINGLQLEKRDKTTS